MKLPPIDGKKKKEGNKKKDEYPEHVVIMDAEDINKAIEGAYRQYYLFSFCPLTSSSLVIQVESIYLIRGDSSETAPHPPSQTIMKLPFISVQIHKLSQS